MPQKKEAIIKLLQENINTHDELTKIKRKIAKNFGIPILTNADIIGEYKNLVAQGTIKKLPKIEHVIRKRSVRTMSGIAPVAVLTKPYPCPGKCVYCPTERDVPQSYLSNEPAVMRAIRCGYNPYVQVQDRLCSLVVNGHEPTKIELIVIGGTWSYLPKKYKYWYIANLYAGANRFKDTNQKIQDTNKFKISNSKSQKDLIRVLYGEQKKNEKAKYKIIGLTLETRPDFINEKELLEMRELGATRVELGVQALDNKILQINKRGHGVKEIAEATKLLKNYGFKVTYHIMPGLPGSTAAKDLKMFKQLFSDERFQPDQIKFYPTVVAKGSLLYRWWKNKKYKPYSDKVLQNLIIKCKAVVPKYVRIIRLIRDIPGESIIAGNKVTNLRQILKAQGAQCNCIRCREPKERKKLTGYELCVMSYEASGGIEYFISFESEDARILYGFCRLRLLDGVEFITHNSLKNSALIRELHVYGELVSMGDNPSTGSERRRKVQHTGLGKKLFKEAEKIAKEAGFDKMSVISGIGVRDYYRKLGYRLEDTYMVKKLS